MATQLLLGEEVEFYIEYEGPVPSQNKGNKLIGTHQIRQCFHPQLAKLWENRLGPIANPPLRDDPAWYEQARKYLDETSGKVTPERVRKRSKFRFLPIVSSLENLVCSLDITLYRREEPGSIIVGGDLDNRIKVVFDAMSTAQHADQLTNISPKHGEHPFFCLLQDDSLITAYKISTLQLWTAGVAPAEYAPDYFKVSVKVKMSRTRFAGWGIAALPDV